MSGSDFSLNVLALTDPAQRGCAVFDARVAALSGAVNRLAAALAAISLFDQRDRVDRRSGAILVTIDLSWRGRLALAALGVVAWLLGLAVRLVAALGEGGGAAP